MINSYVVVDLETTGLNLKTDKIMEIGATRVVDGQVTEEFHTMVHPRHQLEEEIMELTGIGDEMLRNASGIEEIVGQAVAFCKGPPLVGYRVTFDYSSLKRAAVNAGPESEKEGAGTLELCRKFMLEEKRKNLGVACCYFRVETGAAYRALSDAQTASGLYQELMRYHGKNQSEASEPKTLTYKVKKEQSATKRQKEGLRELLKYHRTDIAVQIDHLSKSEVSRMMDKVISKYGRIVRR